MLVLAYSWWVDHYVYAIADNNIVWIFREIKFSRNISGVSTIKHMEKKYLDKKHLD